MNPEKRKEIFEKLSSIKLDNYIKHKKVREQGKERYLNYISWATAWKLVCKEYPGATFRHVYWEDKPYLYDKNLGYLVGIEVDIDGEVLTSYLPVMDGQNRAMKDAPYTYRTSTGEKHVNQATFFDINTAWQRCLVKTLALFGLGIDLYTGEDLENILKDEEEEEIAPKIETQKQVNTQENTEKVWLSQKEFEELMVRKNKAEIIKVLQIYDNRTVRNNKVYLMKKEYRDALNLAVKN